jgi:HK97 gp10 family phage protein
MATKGRINTKGFEQYLERIARAGSDIDAAAGRALQAGGDVLLAGMKRRVPKDTRNLEEHLVIDGPHQDGNYIYIDVGIPSDKRTDAETARYGNAQEYGTSSMPAQPYIRPTMDEERAKARRAMRSSLKKERMVD